MCLVHTMDVVLVANMNNDMQDLKFTSAGDFIRSQVDDDGPFKNAFNSDVDGVIRREINTYRIKGGIMVKESACRDYYKSGDYHDSQSTTPIVER